MRHLMTVRLAHEDSGIVYDFDVYRAEVSVTRRLSTTHKRSEFNTTRCKREKARALYAWLLRHGYRQLPA